MGAIFLCAAIFFVCYQLLSLIFFPAILLFLFIRPVLFGNKKIHAFSWERFGFVPQFKKKDKIVWLHAASVGEVISLQYLISWIEQEKKGYRCFVTVGTDTARSVACSFISPDYLAYVPYDFLPCVLLAFWRIKPAALIIVEGELWPNLIAVARWHHVPLYGLNAKISVRSYRRFKFFSPVTASIFGSFDALFAQSADMAERFIALGARRAGVTTLGNLKAYNVYYKKQKHLEYTAQGAGEPERDHGQFNVPVLLVGSLHPEELEPYLELYEQVKKKYPAAKLILAPRHFAWLNSMISQLDQDGLSYVIWENQNQEQASLAQLKEKDILVVAVLGKLFDLYQHATIFYLGGTIAPIGGHNLLEPAMWGTPMVIGPHYDNCKIEADELESIGGLYKITTKEQLAERTFELLAHDALRKKMRAQTLAWAHDKKLIVEQNLKQNFLSLLQ